MYKNPLSQAIIILVLCSSYLFAETNSSKRIKSSDSVNSSHGQENKKTSPKANVPETIFPTKKTIRNTIILKGFIEDPDAITVSIDTQNWGDLRVSNPPKHGKEVKKEKILSLDLEKIRTNLQLLPMTLIFWTSTRIYLWPKSNWQRNLHSPKS